MSGGKYMSKRCAHHHRLLVRITVGELLTPNFPAEICSWIQVIDPESTDGGIRRDLKFIVCEFCVRQHDSEILLQFENVFSEDVELLFFPLVCRVDAPVCLWYG